MKNLIIILFIFHFYDSIILLNQSAFERFNLSQSMLITHLMFLKKPQQMQSNEICMRHYLSITNYRRKHLKLFDPLPLKQIDL